MSHTIEPVARVTSCYREKFGIPRQPSLVPEARARVVFLPPFDAPEVVRGLDAFSHVWLTFGFHAVAAGKWSPTVRPPRLGGNTRVGVFATRSTHRPNGLGQSLVRLDAVHGMAGSVALDVSGHDLLDGTPVYDVKPYLPFVEAVPDARAGFAPAAPRRRRVTWSNEARSALLARAPEPENAFAVIEGVLAQDPRPAYRRGGAEPERVYGVRLFAFDVRFVVTDDAVRVVSVDNAERA